MPPAATGPGAASGADAPSPDSGQPRPWLIRKRGAAEVLRCPDLTTLRQWIGERRIARDDEISRSGQRFRRMGSIVELESLFYSAEQERAQQRRNSGQFAQVPVAPAQSAASAPRLTPVPTPVATTPGAGAPSPRPTPVPAAETRSPEPAAAKKPEPAPAKKPEPAPARKSDPPEAAKPSESPEPAAAPGPAAAPSADKKPTDAVGTVKVTPPPGLAASAGGLSPMRLARKEPNRGKPQAMPGMAGSVQAAMRAAGTPPSKPPAAGSEAKRPEPAAASARPVTAAAATPAARAAAAPAAKPAAGSAKAEAATSGAQTAVFTRKDKDDLDDDDADVTRKLPPADSRATERQPAQSRDPVEDAILRNDPVPRHLKEAAEGGDTIRKAPKDTDSTEFVDKGATKSRGPLLLVIAMIVIGGGIWYYTQTSDNPTGEQPSPGTSEPAKSSAPPSAEPGSTTKEPETTPPAPVVEPLPPATGTTGTSPPAAVNPPEPAKPEPAKPAAKPEPAKPAQTATGTEPAKPAAAKPEPAKPESATPAPTATPETAATAKPTISLEELRRKIGEDIPKGFDDQMELAQRLVERYKYDSAQALYEYLLTYASAVPAIHNGLGTCAFEKNRADEAIQHYRDALERRPSYSAAVFGLAKTYHRLKNDKEQALIYYKKYLELNPKGSAAAISREAIAKLEGQSSPPSPAPAAP